MFFMAYRPCPGRRLGGKGACWRFVYSAAVRTG